MVKVTCNESKIEFEAATARTKQHPRIAALKAEGNKRGNYREVNEALEAVRKAGGYATIDEFMAKVNDIFSANAAKMVETSKRAREAAAKHAEEMQQAKTVRERQNAFLREHGYKWSKVETTGYFGGIGDEQEWSWILFAPDGRSVTVQQALDEIARAGVTNA
jgi:hypothetical protein